MPSRFERAVFAALRRGDAERFDLPSPSVERLAGALHDALAHGDAAAEVRRALQLVVAFERTLDSPSAAKVLRGLLRDDPEALRLVRAEARRKKAGLDEARRFLRQEGRAATLRAPPLPPPGSARGLRVADFLDPRGAPRGRPRGR